MRWKNKGHEYDEMAEKFIADNSIWIYGAGDYGARLHKLLKRMDVPVNFIDGNRKKQLEGFQGEKVFSPVEFFKNEEKRNVVIAAMTQYSKEMRKNLEEHGYVYGENFWEMEDFTQNILPIYLVYVKDKIYMDSIGFLSTTICNLRCDGCLNFTEYNKKQCHVDLEEAKKTLDTYFNVVDFVRFISYTGGEPLLYPKIDELLSYIGENYRNKIGILGMSTNCTLVPGDTTCEILQKYNFHVYIDDYSKYVKKSKEILPLIVEKFKAYSITYTINDGESGYWIDLAPFKTDNTNMSEEELTQYRKKCAVPYRELRNEKLYSCNYASFAMKAGIQEEEKNDWYDLKSHMKANNKELMEFILGYTEKGYVDFCKHCAGFLPINPYKKPIGEQLD